MSDSILLSTNDDRAEILICGAELRSWRVGGVDLIWEPDPAVWNQTAPILFPVVGWTRGGRARVGWITYPLSLHGFAWKKRFAIAEQGSDFVRLALEDDAETRAQYPFAFRFEVEFRLAPGVLENRLIVTNVGDGPLPYACGLHPAFRWPLAGSSATHAILFDEAERPEVAAVLPGGLIGERSKPVPLAGKRLPLTPDMFANDALVFLDANSRGFCFDNGAGARVRATLEDFPHIAFWTLPGNGYLCLEPWTGYGDTEGFYGDLFGKPSMRRLAPGASASHGARFAFERDADKRA